VGYEQEVNFTVEDNGKGFDVTILDKGKGNGWKNIMSRANLIHGELNLDSSLGRMGTSLMVRIPLTAMQESVSLVMENTQ
jgi:signal transduction histidine kinase